MNEIYGMWIMFCYEFSINFNEGRWVLSLVSHNKWAFIFI